MRKQFFVLAILAIGLLLISGCSSDDSNQLNGTSNPVVSPLPNSIRFSQVDETSTAMDDGDDGHPWGNHDHPWEFLWDNGLDDNHEFKTLGNSNILGFMYISFTEDDMATGGQDVVGWVVHGKPAEAHWSDSEDKWIVSADDVPHQPGFVHWHPLGDEGVAQGMESAPGYFLKHTATISFYFVPQDRQVEEGIDFDFPMNYMAE